MLTEGILESFEVAIDPQVILSVHGYGAARKPSPAIVEMASSSAAEAKGLVRPRAIYREFPVARLDAESVTLQNGIQFSIGRKISELWEGCRAVGIALYTLGPELEERVSALTDAERQIGALSLDIAGTIALGLVGLQVQQMVCQQLGEQGEEAGPWLNPGYLDWPLTDQRLIFDILPAESIGVRLNDSCMMIPRKSVTVCAGIGIEGSAAGFNRCRHCGVAKCQFRRVTVSSGSDGI
ncbi:MAG: vitamin B12 dependent-methionine synthase activation domain-containing protein [Dehalococcoidia bacterium]|nr:vitamin B12 dependent-methionine synthase activation domain-containing protein [Dehalococcoidia bacterium]